jgi:hypothetical protein
MNRPELGAVRFDIAQREFLRYAPFELNACLPRTVL